MLVVGIVLCSLLALVTLMYIFYEEAIDVGQSRDRVTLLLEKKEQIMENLRDLRFEYKAGKLSEADYERTRLALENEAADILTELGKAQSGTQAKEANVNVS